MSDSNHGAAPVAAPAHEAHHHPNYVKIWGVLLALLVVSVLGPMLEIRVVTLITAFGIALVKAYIVAKHFMHVNLERRFVGYLLIAMVALSLLFVGGTSADVMKHDGARWENTAAKAAVQKGMQEGAHHEKGEHRP